MNGEVEVNNTHLLRILYQQAFNRYYNSKCIIMRSVQLITFDRDFFSGKYIHENKLTIHNSLTAA